jgi:hypothetical protein
MTRKSATGKKSLREPSRPSPLRGKSSSKSIEFRYVVLHHTGIENPHFDLMLELSPNSDLSTWRVPHWPPTPGDKFTPLPNHRREYLEYEGPVSNNRGKVKRIAAGTAQLIRQEQNQILVSVTRLNLSLPTFA